MLKIPKFYPISNKSRNSKVAVKVYKLSAIQTFLSYYLHLMFLIIFPLNLDEIEEHESDDLIVQRETQAKGM